MEATLELCINTEWLANNWLGGECPEGWDDEITTVAVTAACRALHDRGLDYDLAQGQRALYHGWNGAHFDDLIGCFGVWGKLTEGEESLVWEAVEAGRAAATIESQSVNDD